MNRFERFLWQCCPSLGRPLILTSVVSSFRRKIYLCVLCLLTEVEFCSSSHILILIRRGFLQHMVFLSKSHTITVPFWFLGKIENFFSSHGIYHRKITHAGCQRWKIKLYCGKGYQHCPCWSDRLTKDAGYLSFEPQSYSLCNNWIFFWLKLGKQNT